MLHFDDTLEPTAAAAMMREARGGWTARPAGRLGCAHGHAARAAALDDGLLAEEIDQVLAGRRMTDAFPVQRGENPGTYAARAVAEMMVAYLS